MNVVQRELIDLDGTDPDFADVHLLNARNGRCSPAGF
jgi:hypothetical protein